MRVVTGAIIRVSTRERPDLGGRPGSGWLVENLKVFSTDRNLPGVVTALSVNSSEGAVTLPEAFTSILPGLPPLPVLALFTRGRT